MNSRSPHVAVGRRGDDRRRGAAQLVAGVGTVEEIADVVVARQTRSEDPRPPVRYANPPRTAWLSAKRNPLKLGQRVEVEIAKRASRDH